ncbi:Putative ribosomal protein S18 [Septoria linicola]|uniref:Small ribosomal subunit protein bS18m n=1 Tax=Septoria linicola TaxID=215465 RepID=A0A9Q9EMT4_9PEZI|nr:putative ribosomal protein S18 [Septoria linicola]USW55814.1 Putative ribosomal protein S18 [Septoria linicola]
MSLESAFRRLTVRSCQQCRRQLSTSPATRQQQSNATAAFADLFQNGDNSPNSQTTTAAPSRPTTSTPTAPFPAAAGAASPTESPGWSLARQAVEAASASRRQHIQRQMALDTERGWNRADLERQAVHRRWKAGDVYAPHDLTGIEMAKWKKMRRRPKPKFDVVDQLHLKPKDMYKNFSVMSEYMTDMGRIRHSNETNLRPVNQRRMAKAIRRAIGVGVLMPSTHRHPEILRMEMGGRRSF